jgi:hypothetical protein
MSKVFCGLLSIAVVVAACGRTSVPTSPSATPSSVSGGGAGLSPTAAEPPFNLEAVLRGDGFGLVKFRQQKDTTSNIIALDVWVRDLLPNTSYRLQRAVDTQLDGACTGTNWLTLGLGLTPQAILTDETGTGRADLFRDLSALSPGTAFDIHFRVIEDVTAHVALESGCYRFVVRD